MTRRPLIVLALLGTLANTSTLGQSPWLSQTAQNSRVAGPFQGTLFYKKQSPPDTIVSLNLATGLVRPLFRASYVYLNAAGEILYTNTRTGTLILADLSGKISGQLQPENLAKGRATLSPDGKFIAYPSSSATNVGTQILTRSGEPVMWLGGHTDATWLPDGRLVCIGPDGLSNYPVLLILDLNQTSGVPVSVGRALNRPAKPAVSPDGQHLAFEMNRHIWIIRLDGTGLRQLSQGNGQEVSPAWSPDGQAVVAMHIQGVLQGAMIYPLDGRPAVSIQLPTGTLKYETPPIWR